jgi:hypothetical protein
MGETVGEWWRSITERLNKLHPEAEGGPAPPVSLRDRLEHEKERLREEAERQEKAEPGQTLAPGESREEAELQDRRVLIALLGWKLDVRFEPGQFPTTNPAKVEGYWFGVRRYWRYARAEGEEDRIGWKLFFHRVCPNCKALVPTLELGDYAEVDAAAAKMMVGGEAQVGKSTHRLASYLNDLEAGRPDPHCPRLCPGCRKLMKGGTL